MKKAFIIALVSALFAGINPAEAQVRFGVKGGINLTNLSFEKDNYYNIGNKAGFHIGPTLMYSLPIKGLGLDAAVMYDQRSGSAEADIIDGRIYPTTIKRQQIVVPVNVRYDFGQGKSSQFKSSPSIFCSKTLYLSNLQTSPLFFSGH